MRFLIPCLRFAFVGETYCGIMAKKNQDIGKGGCGKQQRSVKNLNNDAKSPVKIAGGDRGDRVPSPTANNPRTSPGLLAGHYAGCKWSEPPLPSALPLPPQHWMLKQQQQRVPSKGDSNNNCVAQPTDIAQQLKVLLKVQA